VRKEQDGRKSLRRLKPTVGCNAIKRRRKKYTLEQATKTQRGSRGRALLFL